MAQPGSSLSPRTLPHGCHAQREICRTHQESIPNHD
jgi:hypothetical protein